MSDNNNNKTTTGNPPPPKIDKLLPNDPRVQHAFYTIPSSRHNVTYHYLLASPSDNPPRGTVLLIHGFPDLSFSWRYQVPHLLSLGLRVIVPDMPGYGRSSAPEKLEAYSMRTVCEDLVQLVRHVQGKKDGEDVEKVVIGGHDWGGMVVWRMVLWFPEVVSGVFSVCTGFYPPREEYFSPEQVVKRLPNFGYQVQFAGNEVEGKVTSREAVGGFLRGMFGGRRKDDGKVVFKPTDGVLLDRLLEDPNKVGPSPLLDEAEMEFYADEYMRNGLRGPLCWYKTGRINFEEELELLKRGKTRVTMPALYIGATRDVVLPPWMMANMGKYFDDLTTREVDATHWALWEAAEDVNKHLTEFVEKVLGPPRLKASI